MKDKYTRAALGRYSFIEVEKNVRLHISDLGEGDPIVLIHGLPFSNAMFEYQFQYFNNISAFKLLKGFVRNI